MQSTAAQPALGRDEFETRVVGSSRGPRRGRAQNEVENVEEMDHWGMGVDEKVRMWCVCVCVCACVCVDEMEGKERTAKKEREEASETVNCAPCPSPLHSRGEVRVNLRPKGTALLDTAAGQLLYELPKHGSQSGRALAARFRTLPFFRRDSAQDGATCCARGREREREEGAVSLVQRLCVAAAEREAHAVV